MSTLKRGFLISIEGIDGAGKSTLANSIQTHLSNDNIPILLTKEPGGTPLGAKIRALLLDTSYKTSHKAEFLLFAADRAHHMETLIKPALEQKYVVISDRMADSSVVYQGYGRGIDIPAIQSVNSFAMGSVRPDLVLYVKISLPTALERLKKRQQSLTTFEEKADFTAKLIAGFDTHFAHRSDVVVLDGEKSEEEVAQQALTALYKLIHT